MALTITPTLGNEAEQTLTNANEALEINWGTKPPRRFTFQLSAAGGYAFTGTDGQALGATRFDVIANSPYEIELRDGKSRRLDVTAIFIESDTAAATLQINKEW